MAKQIILYNLRDDVKEEDYIQWCNEYKGPLLLGLPSTHSYTLLRMLGGRKGDGKKGIAPEETKPAFRYIGILDVSSKEDWTKDMGTKAYREEFFTQFFTKWVADFQAIIGEEVYHGTKRPE